MSVKPEVCLTFVSKLEIACQHVQFPKKRHSKAFVCLLFFILSERLLKDNVNTPCIYAIFIHFVVSYYGYGKNYVGTDLATR